MSQTIKVTSPFWLERQQVIRQEMIPYQWDVMTDLKTVNITTTNTGGDSSALDTSKSYAIENFKVAAGKSGIRGGMVFQDSDVYKWLEAAAYTLEGQPDPELLAKTEGLVDLIAAAQQEDGYLNTYFIVNEPERKYQSLYMSHELYCAGHLIEAAVAYHQATGNQKILDVAIKLADNIDRNFGPEDGKIHGADGHEEIELALIKLYDLTKEERYLKLSHYLLSVRGQDPEFFIKQMKNDVALGRKSLIPGLEIIHPDFSASYFQADKPVSEQVDANGHAVRVVYLCTALAAAAALTHDQQLEKAAATYWDNIVNKRYYLTGAIGSTAHGEAFTADYDLPNDSMYGETCASVGLTFFANAMFRLNHHGSCADVMEQALYNTVLSGMALDGKSYFYVNPLESTPLLSKKNPGLRHSLSRRAGWFACACCPPNLARMVMSLGHYIYHVTQDTIFANLYVASEAHLELADSQVELKQESNYPWEGSIKFTFTKVSRTGCDSCGCGASAESHFKFALRIPQWCEHFTVKLNGAPLENPQSQVKDGVIYLEHAFKSGDVVELDLDMEPRLVEASPLIAVDYGKVAVTRGPIVYCAEECDNGPQLHCLHIGNEGQLKGSFDPKLLGGVYVIEAAGQRRVMPEHQASGLYQRAKAPLFTEQKVKLIPYCVWCNRAEGEMRVWLNPAPCTK